MGIPRSPFRGLTSQNHRQRFRNVGLPHRTTALPACRSRHSGTAGSDLRDESEFGVNLLRNDSAQFIRVAFDLSGNEPNTGRIERMRQVGPWFMT